MPRPLLLAAAIAVLSVSSAGAEGERIIPDDRRIPAAIVVQAPVTPPAAVVTHSSASINLPTLTIIFALGLLVALAAR